jgi:hypothetical protein
MPLDLAPGAGAPQALEDHVLDRDVHGHERGRIHLFHHELVVPVGPGHELDEDLAHLLLDGRDQILGLERVQLDQDRAQAMPRPDLLARLEVMARRDASADQQALAEALVGVAARGVDDLALVKIEALRDVTHAERQDPGLAAREERAQQLRDAGGLDLAAYREVVVRLLAVREAHQALSSLPISALSQSIGTGNRIVEFFSAAISVRVWR